MLRLHPQDVLRIIRPYADSAVAGAKGSTKALPYSLLWVSSLFVPQLRMFRRDIGFERRGSKRDLARPDYYFEFLSNTV